MDFWRCFTILSRCRSWNDGYPLPILYQDITTYAQSHGISTLDILEEVVLDLDAEWLTYMNKQIKAKMDAAAKRRK